VDDRLVKNKLHYVENLMRASKYESNGMTRDIDIEYDVLEEMTFFKVHNTGMKIEGKSSIKARFERGRNLLW
jgi:hypothetical protein